MKNRGGWGMLGVGYEAEGGDEGRRQGAGMRLRIMESEKELIIIINGICTDAAPRRKEKKRTAYILGEGAYTSKCIHKLCYANI